MISAKRASEIASEWYAGQWSGLYLIVCHRTKAEHKALTDAQLCAAYDECAQEWSISRVANPQYSRSLFALLEYITSCRPSIADSCRRLKMRVLF